ncbi:MAG: glycosyltransferase [Candidatus Fermentibacteraceae bacterium]|nr:glycosyltransferase [Candidatus Fermentibacteraceae bacterium]MBN2609224.1 glycosyltransferase [Candidatus Fermentibacteraceae bacterium]
MTERLFWVFLVLFLSSWMLYPLVIAVLALFIRRHRDSWETPSEWPAVSVLVAARNEEETIGSRIANLLDQDYSGKLEILVGSDSSDDRTDAIVRSFSSRGVVLHRSPERIGKPLMLLRLREMASGSVLVFTDADTVFAEETVSRLVTPYSNPRVGCVDGCRRNSLDRDTCESIYWRYEKTVKRLCSHMGAVLGATGAVFSIRRDLFAPVSPGRGDDFELAVMARVQGYDCVFNQDAVAMEPSPDDSMQYRRMVRIVSWMLRSCVLLMGRALRRGRIFLFLQLLVHKMLRWFSGLFLIAATVLAGSLSGGSVTYTAIFIMMCLFHAAAAGGLLLRRRMPSGLLFPYYFWLMNGAAIDGIIRALSGNPMETWEKGKGGAS